MNLESYYFCFCKELEKMLDCKCVDSEVVFSFMMFYWLEIKREK
jgi:hypothetical protein